MGILFFQKKKTIATLLCIQNNQPKRKYWVHPINKLRSKLGDQVKLDIKYEKYPDRFRKETRFTPEQFDELLLLLEERLAKRSQRESISPRVRLYVTLKYLAQGISMQALSDGFSMGHSTVSKIIAETTRIIWDALSPIFLPQPTTDDWLRIAQEFKSTWQYPNCVGALDGKHVLIQCPNKSSSLFFNYKKTFSINLMAMCDANYRFIMVDVGGYGRQNDSGVFRDSPFGSKVLQGQMNFPSPTMLPGSTLAFPFVIVADDAFPMSENIIKPFPGTNLDIESN